MKKYILPLAIVGISLASAAQAETTVTKTVDPSTGTVTTTTFTRQTDTDPRVKTVRTEQQFVTYAYDRWDQNGDGYVTPDEWDSNVTTWYGPGVTTYKTYADWDRNHNGKLDQQEFNRVINETNLYKTWNVETVTTPAATTIDSSFATYDLNGDGSITPSEWSQVHGK